MQSSPAPAPYPPSTSPQWELRNRSFINPQELQQLRQASPLRLDQPVHEFSSSGPSFQNDYSPNPQQHDSHSRSHTVDNALAPQQQGPSHQMAPNQTHGRSSSFFSFRSRGQQQPSDASSGPSTPSFPSPNPSTFSGRKSDQPFNGQPNTDFGPPISQTRSRTNGAATLPMPAAQGQNGRQQPPPPPPPDQQPDGIGGSRRTLRKQSLSGAGAGGGAGGLPQPQPLHPEIRSVVQLTLAHARKVYFSGPLVRKVERHPDGQRPQKEDPWADVWAQLGGTTLSIWDMREVEEANKQGKEVPPTYVNMTDAFVHVLGPITVPAQGSEPARKFSNVLSLNSAGSNLLLFACPDVTALLCWAAALRLSAWEKSRLEEIYTAHLIRITLPEGRDAPSTLNRGRMEGWVRIRVAGQTDWKRMWMVVTADAAAEDGGGGRPASPQKRRLSNFFSSGRDSGASQSNGRPGSSSGSGAAGAAGTGTPGKGALLSFFAGPKPRERKKALLSLRDLSQAFAVYPERPELINRSTLMKVEGLMGDEETAGGMKNREGWLLIMPELESGNTQASEMLKWLVALHDAFALYGRPKPYSWDPRDPVSMMFGYPVGPGKDLLFLDREAAEAMDPRDDRTSVVRSRLLQILTDRMRGIVVPPPEAPPSLPPLTLGSAAAVSEAIPPAPQLPELDLGSSDDNSNYGQNPPLQLGNGNANGRGNGQVQRANSPPSAYETPSAEYGRTLSPITERDTLGGFSRQASSRALRSDSGGESRPPAPPAADTKTPPPRSPGAHSPSASFTMGNVGGLGNDGRTISTGGESFMGRTMESSGESNTRSSTSQAPASPSSYSGMTSPPPTSPRSSGLSPEPQAAYNASTGRFSMTPPPSPRMQQMQAQLVPNTPSSRFSVLTSPHSPNTEGKDRNIESFVAGRTTSPTPPPKPERSPQRNRASQLPASPLLHAPTPPSKGTSPSPVASTISVNSRSPPRSSPPPQQQRQFSPQPQPQADAQEEYNSNAIIYMQQTEGGNRGMSAVRRMPTTVTEEDEEDASHSHAHTQQSESIYSQPSQRSAFSQFSQAQGRRGTPGTPMMAFGESGPASAADGLGRRPSGARAPTHSRAIPVADGPPTSTSPSDNTHQAHAPSPSPSPADHSQPQTAQNAMAEAEIPQQQSHQPPRHQTSEDDNADALAALSFLDREPSTGHGGAPPSATAAEPPSDPPSQSGSTDDVHSGGQYRSTFAPSKQAAERKARAQAQQAAQQAAAHKPGRANGKPMPGKGGGKNHATSRWTQSSDEEEEEDDEDEEEDADSDDMPPPASTNDKKTLTPVAPTPVAPIRSLRPSSRGATASPADHPQQATDANPYAQLRNPQQLRNLPVPPRGQAQDDYFGPAQQQQQQQQRRYTDYPRAPDESMQHMQQVQGMQSMQSMQSPSMMQVPQASPYDRHAAARQTIWTQVLEPGRMPGANPLPDASPQQHRDTFIQLEAPAQHMTKAFTPHGLLSAGIQDKSDRSAKKQEEMAREMGASLINMPNKPPPPQTGLLGAITAHERERKREGGVGAALTEREREKRLAEDRQRKLDDFQRQQLEMAHGSMYAGAGAGGQFGFNPMAMGNPMMMGMNPMMTGGAPMNPMMTGGFMGGYPGMMPGYNPQMMMAAQHAAQAAYQQAMMSFAGSQMGGEGGGGGGGGGGGSPGQMGGGQMGHLSPMMTGQMGGFDPRMSMMMPGMMSPGMGGMGGMGMGMGMGGMGGMGPMGPMGMQMTGGGSPGAFGHQSGLGDELRPPQAGSRPGSVGPGPSNSPARRGSPRV